MINRSDKGPFRAMGICSILCSFAIPLAFASDGSGGFELLVFHALGLLLGFAGLFAKDTLGIVLSALGFIGNCFVLLGFFWFLHILSGRGIW
jgi:hypothetical protein